MNNEIFLIAAYTVIWAGLFAYVFYANRQQAILGIRVQALEEVITEQRRNND